MNPAMNPAIDPATSDEDVLPTSFVADVLPAWAARRVMSILPGTSLVYVESEWRNAIVAVTSGDVVLEGRLGGALWLTCGDIFWFDGVEVHRIHNHGADPAVLVAVSRAAGPGTRESTRGETTMTITTTRQRRAGGTATTGVGHGPEPVSHPCPRLAVMSTSATERRAARLDPDASPDGDVSHQLEVYRRELTAYCYRMLGSGFEAEDAVQETMVRAWKNLDRFEGRSALRSWLYRIATNVCLDMHRGPQRRARPMDLGPSSRADSALDAGTAEHAWVQPIANAKVIASDGDPAEIATARESVRLAFVAALQHLPPKQRAVLILRDVLHWHADEVAELLDTSVASANSALQRARASLSVDPVGDSTVSSLDPSQQKLMDRYVDAFERYDIEQLVAILRDDAVMSMPPFELWLRGSDQIAAFFVGHGAGCRGSRLVRTEANGRVAFGSYKIDPAGGHAPWGLQILEVADGKIVGLHCFIDGALFPEFGLPTHL